MRTNNNRYANTTAIITSKGMMYIPLPYAFEGRLRQLRIYGPGKSGTQQKGSREGHTYPKCRAKGITDRVQIF